MNEFPDPYQLVFEVRDGYLYAGLKAETISQEIISGYVADVIAKAHETGKSKVLLYRDIPAVMSTHQVFGTVNDSLDAFRGIKLALVNPHAAIDEDIKFGLTVGQNRGGNYKSFNNVEDAEAWLLG